MPGLADISAEVIGGLIVAAMLTIGASVLGYLKRFKPNWRGWDWAAISDVTFHALKCIAAGVVIVGMFVLVLIARQIAPRLATPSVQTTGTGAQAAAVAPEGTAATLGPRERVTELLDQLAFYSTQVLSAARPA